MSSNLMNNFTEDHSVPISESKLERLLRKTLLFLLVTFTFIEMLNGYTTHNSLHFFNAIFSLHKIFFLGILLLNLVLVSKFRVNLWFLISSLFVFILFIQILLPYSEPSISGEIITPIRTVEIYIKMSMAICIFFLSDVYRFTTKEINSIIFFNSIVIIFNFVLAWLGFGTGNYVTGSGESFGATGYFYAGNELSIAFIFSYSLVLFVWGNKLANGIWIVMLYGACSITLISKTALLSYIVITIIYLFIISKLWLLLFSLTLSFFGLYYLSLIINYFSFAINRWLYLSNLYGMEYFLLGGFKRLSYISIYIDRVFNDPYLLLIGYGWSGEAENNLFDLVEGYGLIGLLIFSIWLYYLCIKPAKNSSTKNKLKICLIASGLLAFLVLIMAGHVVQSALIIPFIAPFAFIINHTQDCMGTRSS